MLGKRPVAIADFERVWSIDAVSWRPGGAEVAIAMARPDFAHDRYRRTVRSVDLETGRTTPIGSSELQCTAPSWSPDGSRLAFLQQRDGGRKELAVWAPGRDVVSYPGLLPEGVDGFVWAPDSRRLCLVGTSYEPERDPGDSRPRVIERLPYKSDGVGFTFDSRSDLYLWDLETEELRRLTDGPWSDRQAAFSPDGERLAFVSERHPTRGLDLGADLFVLHIGSGELRQLTPTQGQVDAPAWSPDGTMLAYAGTDRLRSAPSHRRVWVVPAAGGPPRCVSSGWDRDIATMSPDPVAFFSDTHVAALFAEEGRVTWEAFDVESGDRVQAGPADEWQIAAWSLRPDRRALAYAASSVARPPEVFLQEGLSERPRRITRLHDAWMEEVSLVDAEAFTGRSEDGTEVPAWFMPPAGHEGDAKAPIMLRIHGGPFSQYGVGFALEFQYWSGRGYGVVFGNPRGSAGYGEAWARDLRTNRGVMDQQDVLAELDEALRRWPWLDPDRAIVEGYSYGGFLTSWLIGHTDRFRVACTGAAPNNLYSQQGTTDLTATNYPFTQGFNILENPAFYIERSPITYANDIETPTLIIHGENDMRVPIGQGEELFAALALRGIPVRFVRFPGAGHGFVRAGKPSHRQARLEEMTAWFDRWLAEPRRRRAPDQEAAAVTGD